jgi:hypothetical protein
MTPAEERLRNIVARKLEEIRPYFTNTNAVRLTIVIRTPWLADGGILISDEEDLNDAVKEMTRLMAKTEAP